LLLIIKLSKHVTGSIEESLLTIAIKSKIIILAAVYNFYKRKLVRNKQSQKKFPSG